LCSTKDRRKRRSRRASIEGRVSHSLVRTSEIEQRRASDGSCCEGAMDVDRIRRRAKAGKDEQTGSRLPGGEHVASSSSNCFPSRPAEIKCSCSADIGTEADDTTTWQAHSHSHSIRPLSVDAVTTKQCRLATARPSHPHSRGIHRDTSPPLMLT
jgi:hypothetical protein